MRQRIGFDAQGQLSRVELLAPDGTLEWAASYADYQPVDGVPFAHDISLFVAEGPTRVRIALRDVELNPELPEGVFHVRAAAGAAER